MKESEANEIIAKFMGLTEWRDNPKSHHQIKTTDYSNSIDALIPVIEKYTFEPTDVIVYPLFKEMAFLFGQKVSKELENNPELSIQQATAISVAKEIKHNGKL